MKTLLGLFITVVLSCSLQAQTQSSGYAIVGATVHTLGPKGSLKDATVLLKDGKIQQVLTQGQVPAGYEIIDAKGKVVTPGLFGAHTRLGLVEVGMSAGTVDSSSKVSQISSDGAGLDVSYAINSASTLMDISRIAGITSAATSLSNTGQLFQGQGAVISLGDKAQPLISSRAFVTIDLSNGGIDENGESRAVTWVALESALQEAEFAKGKSLTPLVEWHGDLAKADLKALLPVVSGEIPLLIDVRRVADIRQVLALKKRHSKLNIVLLQATEAWMLADELAKAKIAVIISPERNLPYAFDQLGATMQNAARLNAAGVKVSIGMETHNIRLATQHAGNAVANGLPWLDGLAALTINPATVYGLGQQFGSIEAGKQADVVIWSGDPLQVTETAEQVFIKGEKILMESRQTKLRDRYLNLGQAKPMRFVHP